MTPLAEKLRSGSWPTKDGGTINRETTPRQFAEGGWDGAAHCGVRGPEGVGRGAAWVGLPPASTVAVRSIAAWRARGGWCVRGTLGIGDFVLGLIRIVTVLMKIITRE